MQALAFIAAVPIAWLIVRGIRVLATTRGWIDRPNERSSHLNPTPRGGGIAIVTVTIAGTIIDLAILGLLRWQWAAILAAAAAVAVVSWIDDVRSLPSSVRLAVHLIAAAVAVAALGPIRQITLPGLTAIATSWLAIPLTVCWVAGLTNIYNFMDGIDGIAGAQGIVAALAWIVIGKMTNDAALTVTAGFLAASSLAFLFYNWPPASIFMGDVGSAFMGYLFAVFAIEGGSNALIPFAAALIVWPFLFDSTFTLIRRLSKREDITQAHRSHLYQRLVRGGLSHEAVTLLYSVLAAIGAILAIAIVGRFPGWQAVYGIIPAAAIGLWLLVRRVERRRAGLLADVSQ